jgi:DNA polymerase-4
VYKEASRQVFEIYREYTPLMSAISLDEAYLDVTDHLGNYPTATAIAKEIRQRVRDECGLTVSIGVAPSRLVAKIASDFNKPDGLTVVPPPKVLDFLAPLPARAIWGVGRVMAERLARLDIRTIQDIRDREEQWLRSRLGGFGGYLYHASRGVDNRSHRKRGRGSLGAERTFRPDISDPVAIRELITGIAQRVAERLQYQELSPTTVTLKVRYGDDRTTITRAARLQIPSNREDVILDAALSLIPKTEAGDRPVRLLGVSTSGFPRKDRYQLELWEE